VAADGGAVDADGPASLLPGLDLFVHSLLFGDNDFQGVGHPLELLLVCIVEFIHALGEGAVYHMIAAGVLGGCFMYHGDNFTQEGDLLILERRGHGSSSDWIGGGFFGRPGGLLVFLWGCDVSKGFARGCSAIAEVVVLLIHQESTLRADPLSLVPVCTCFDGVKVSVAGYFEQLVRVQHRAVTGLHLVAAVVAPARVVAVVFHLAVNAIIVIVVGSPMEEGVVVSAGLSYSGQWWRKCCRWGFPSIGCGAGDAPVVFEFGHGGEFRVVVVSEGPAFIGVGSGGGRHANFGGPASRGSPRGTAGRDRGSFRNCGRDTKYGQGRGNRST